MLNTGGIFFLAAVVQVVLSQPPPPPSFLANIPAECQKPPRARPHECCEIPPFIDEDKLAACGIEKPKQGEPHHMPGPPDCSKGICLLKSHNLLDDDNKMKIKEMAEFLDEWVKANPEFEKATETARTECLKEGGPPGPPHICETDRFFFCMTGNLLFNCPKWKETDVCKELQEHMNKCHKYFANPPPQ